MMRAFSKLQLPLTKMLRNNVGSRSKIRSSRSSPIFYIRGRRNAAAGVMIQTVHEEPSSPQVTCIGQVRAGESSVARRRRWFMKKAPFLSGFYSRRRAFRRILCKWVLFFRAGYCKKVDAEEDCFSVGRKMEHCFSEKCENLEIRVGENGRNFAVVDHDSCRSPPRNALILTRLGKRSCRNDHEESEESQINIPVCENEVGESRIIRQESGVDLENPMNYVQDLEGNVVHPNLTMTRCKSEPAATGELKERFNLHYNSTRQLRLARLIVLINIMIQHAYTV